MGGRADGQAHLHRIAHADALEEGWQNDRADDTGDDNRNRGDGVTPPSISATATAIGVVTDSAREKASCFRSDRTDG